MEAREPGAIDLLEVIRHFLVTARGVGGSPEGNERALALDLDRLALATHGPRVESPETEVLGSSPDYDEVRARVAARFPSLGFYREVSVEMREEDQVQIGDAADDLTDMVVDLSQVVWLWEHSCEADARWQFHF